MIIKKDGVEEFLEHHGVKGQQWGIRNFNRQQRAKRARKKALSDVVTSTAAGALTGGLVDRILLNSGVDPASSWTAAVISGSIGSYVTMGILNRKGKTKVNILSRKKTG